jgi:uncharacterized protein YdhG (YjbR/CyaY superfamily)
MRYTVNTVDEYMAGVPPDLRDALERLRLRIRELVPDAVECISYSVPALRLHGRGLLYFAAFKSHCSLFPGAAMIEEFAEELKEYKTSKGTIQFLPEMPIPDMLIQKIVSARAAEVAARKKK